MEESSPSICGDPPAVLALVTARGGSKGLPNKNLRVLAGHPLVAWAVAAGTQAKLVTRIMCSTDSSEIADVARHYGAEVPFMRPDSLAGDETLDLPVFLHALDFLYATESWVPDIVVHLRPTSPLRPKALVDQSIALLFSRPDATSVRAVCPAPCTPYKMWRLDDDSKKGHSALLRPLLTDAASPEPYNTPRQELPKVWWQTGSVDTIRTTTLRSASMSGTAILPLEIAADLAVDIDRASDLARAEAALDREQCVVPGATRTWNGIRLLVLDVDGTLTSGKIYYGPDGEAMKTFHTHDGRGIQMLQDAGITVAIITQESTPFTKVRATKLKIQEIHIGINDKVPVLLDLCQRMGLGLESVAYIGDDLGDVPAMIAIATAGGLPCAVANARPEVLRVAQYVTTNRGGYGAVRDVCDRILSPV